MESAGCWRRMQPSSPAVEPHSVRRARPLLGTRVEIAAGGCRDERSLHAAIDEAFACIERVQQLMSYQDADSDVSRLNRTAPHRALAVNPHTYRVCEAALQFARESEGAFDPTVAARLEEFGILPHAGNAADAHATWRDIELCGDNHIRLHRSLRIDLGGIAKGYAVDRAIAVLQKRDIENALVNAGGDMRVIGSRPQFAHLRHPEAPLHTAHTLTLQNAALATSAAYFSRRASSTGEVSALIDARSGEPYVGRRSVSVRAFECMSADALTKVVLFAPPGLAAACLAAQGADAHVMECA
jgi:FAD:protein FMN transferase